MRAAVNFALPPGFCLLQITPRLDTGGVEQTTLDVAEAVVRAGGRALVASEGGRLEPELAARGGELIRLPMDSKNPLMLWLNIGRLVKLIKTEAVSLVHARSRAPAWSALMAVRRTGVPFVTTYAGLYSAGFPLKRHYNSVMASGDVIIANSAYTREHVIKEHGIHPLEVIAIPRGVDLAHFSPDAVSPERVATLRAAWGLSPDERRPVILLAGRLTRWKGQELLIEAARLLKVQGVNDFIMVLAGDDQGRKAYTEGLKRAISKAGLDGQVRLVGHCADMPAAYLACDIAVAPSLKPEAFGRTAVEPQAMGRPVIAADHGATRETVAPGKTGWLAAPKAAGAWTDALAEALAMTPAERAEMGRAGIERARRLYSLQAMTDATLDVYAGLLMSGVGGVGRKR
jgi:glycosyltransferase involved in cell wall biosynthesis